MCGRALKNYEKYKDAIFLYAKATRLKIVYKNNDCYGMYIPYKRTIEIDPDMPESLEIATLLHELGHSLDDIFSINIANSVSRAYNASYKQKASANQLALVLSCEKNAWEYGRIVAQKTGVPLGKWYEEAKRYCLSGYKSIDK